MFKRLKQVLHRATGSDQDRKDDPAKMQRDQAWAINDAYMSSLMGGWESYNPDMLVRRKGANVYKRMLRDDQVKAAFMMKLSIIVSRAMVFDVKNDGQKEQAEFFERNITDLLSGTWSKALKMILMGKAYGYSVSEKVFRTEMVDGKPRWIIDKIKQKPWHSFNFVTDKYGDVKKIVQEQDTVSKQMNPDKFIVYVNMPEMDDVWGEADLKAAYRPYWEKDITSKFWNIYSERAAGGFILASPNEHISNMSSGEVTKFEKALSNISGHSGLKVPMGYNVTLEMPKDNRSFEEKVSKHDKQIARAILMPNLLGFTEQGTVGSYAQSQTVLDMFMMLIEEEGDYLADILNECLFSQLAFWNFGTTDYPRAKFIPYTTEQKREIAKIWIAAVKDGAVLNTTEDELYTRELLLYPTPEKDDLETARKEKAEAKVAIETKTVPDNDTSKDSTADDDKGTAKKEDAGQVDNTQSTELISQPQVLKVQIEQAAATIVKPNPQAKSKLDKYGITLADTALTNVVNYEDPQFTDRINFTILGDKLDTVEDSFYTGLSSGVDGLVKDVTKGMESYWSKNKEKIEQKKVKKENLVKFLDSGIQSKTKSKIHKTSFNHLQSTYVLGRRTAQKAVNIALKTAPEDIKENIQRKALFTTPRACMIAEWTVMHFVDGISLDTAEAWFGSQAFTITGDLSQDVIDASAEAMMNGIVNELSLNQVIRDMEALLPTLIGTTDKAERSRIETIVRTNMSTIFTQAQLAFYADPALNGFVNGLEYSAILDHRTTPVCNRLEGAKYAIDNPIWGHITPPNHFQCRSILVPATVIDDWRSSTRKYSSGQLPHKGFGQTGFPTKYLTEGAKK